MSEINIIDGGRSFTSAFGTGVIYAFHRPARGHDETLTRARADDGAGPAVLLNDRTTRPTLFRPAR